MRFRKDEGFTLVELMVVVLIIGILVAIAVPVFNSAKANAQKKSCFANMRTVEGAYQTWQADNQGLATPLANPTDYATLVSTTYLVPNYVKSAPVCPSGGTYSAAFTGTGGVAATVSCDFGDPDEHVR
jgi:type IV pilus assembly protein PilA